MSARRWSWVVLVLASCRQIMGIEEAETDPSLTAGSGGAATQGPIVGQTSALGGAADTASPSVGGGGDGQAGDGSEASGAGGQPSVDAAAGAAGAEAAPASLCERYCSAVQSNCTGEFAVYTSVSACLAVCAAMPEGADGDRDVHTVHCRLRAALSALDEVPHYCPIAGPGGNGVCGSDCESLCALRQVVCGTHVSDDVTSCLDQCDTLPDLGSYSTSLERGQYAGNHVQCRLYHLSAAASDDPEQHCLHVDGAAPCQ